MRLSREEINHRISLSRAISSDYSALCPEGLEPLPFQNAGVYYCLTSKQKRHLAGDEPGLGKTIQALLYANAKGFERINVVCPASLRQNWARESEKWLLNPGKIQIVKTGKDKIDPSAKVVITSYNLAGTPSLISHFRASKDALLVPDESHVLKTAKAARTRTMLGRGGIMDMHDETFFISGTQVLNRPIEVFPILSKACPLSIAGMDFWDFARKFCDLSIDKDGFSDYSGASNMKELGARMRAYFMFRRLKKNVLKDLPDKFVKIVYLDPNPRARSAIKRIGNFKLEDIGKGTSAGFEGMSEARKELGISKIPPSLEYLKQQLESRDKIVVFAHHREVIEELEKGLKDFGAVKLYGGMTDDAKQKSVDAFQNDPACRVFVGSISAAGVGITLTAAQWCAFVEASWTPAENQQASDRLHRIGQKFNVEIEFLTYEKSMDERILRSHISKTHVIKELMHDN